MRPARPVLAITLPFLLACAGSDSPGQGSGAAANAPATSPALLKPDAQALAAPAPDTFRVAFETTKGRFVVEGYRAWAPLGADRFYHLARLGFFDENRFFRVLEGFIAQFGVNGDPRANKAFEDLTLGVDPVKETNARGTVTFAMGASPATRTTQMFINFRDNRQLDEMGFAPVGRVVEGMEVVDQLYAGYGEGAPSGFGPDQMRLAWEGNTYVAQQFPKLDYIRKATIVGAGAR